MRRVAGYSAKALTAIGVLLLLYGAYVPTKALLAQWLLEKAWTAQQSGRPEDNGRPWPWADMQVAGQLEAMDIGGSWIVVAGSNARNLAFAPAWMEGSVPPGEEGLAVISAHKDTHFALLAAMKPGHLLRWTNAQGIAINFEVISTTVTDSSTTAIDLGSQQAAHLLLSTCYPFDGSYGGPLRWVVMAARSGSI
jgi:sortase A